MLMDLQTCLKKMELVGVLAFATVDAEGAPYRIRQEHCLHCGSCLENCPVNAEERR